MPRARVLAQLCAALQGDPPPDGDWPAVLALANRSLVTPALSPDIAPPGPARFLAEVRRRNRERNHRLGSQLSDAVAALNAAGLEPTLLKGAALRATLGEPFDRLMSDIDLLLPPADVETSLAALERAGFAIVNRYPGQSVHVVAELGRPQDVGYLDLHQRAPGPPGLADTPALAARRRPVTLAGGRAWAPDPASQVLQIVLHDQFHDGDYWRGGFDLRHLMDLAKLAPLLTGADWAWLREAGGSRLVRAALEAQLVSAERLMGAPPRPQAAARARRTYRRWLLQFAYPAARLPLAAGALALEWPDLLAHRAADRRGRGLGQAPWDRPRPSERLARVRKIATVASGKI